MSDEQELAHIDLFSGIGGFALAAGWAGFRTVAFCEIEPFCQEVLRARFGAVADTEGGADRFDKAQYEGRSDASGQADKPVLIPDIRAFDGTRFRGATLLTGGFPCQPFSVAGKRRGKEDDRHLWPEMLRVVREARPHWVVGENVSGLINMDLDQVLADLEMEGYACRTFHLGAVGVNAPHRRMRVWIVANDARSTESRGVSNSERERISSIRKTNCYVAPPPDPLLGGGGGRGDGDSSRLRRPLQTTGPDSRDIPWPEVAARFCRTPHGLSDWLHRHPEGGLSAKTAERITRQNLPHLWNHLQLKSFWETVGGFGKIPVKENVFAVLWEYFISTTGQNDLPSTGEEASWAILRNVWVERQVGCPSLRWEYQEQRAGELADIVPSLSYEIALDTEKAVKRYSARRVARLKALGNAIVPQVAYQILKAIAEIEGGTP